MELEEIMALVRSVKGLLEDRKKAGEIIVKGKQDFVTRVDTAVQQYLQKALAERYPEIQFMGEENCSREYDPDKPVWILDPVDGTTNLIYDYQMSAVSLGLVEHGEAVLGVVYNPYTDEMFSAQKGKGAFLNGRPIHVSDADKLEDSLTAVGTTPYNKENADEVFALLKQVFICCKDIRRCGAASLDLCYVACGRNDAFLERDLKPWDYAAGAAIITEAGGELCDWTGAPIRFDRNCDILAVNGKLKDAYLPIVSEYVKG